MYRVFAIKHWLYVVSLAGLTTASIFFINSKITANAGAVYEPSTSVMSEFVTKTNTLRQTYGLPNLEPKRELEDSAANKLADMEARSYWGHYGPDNNESFGRFIRTTMPQSSIVGENLARCYADHNKAFMALVQSPTHFAVLTGEFANIGVASAYNDRGCEYIVMHFSS